jgi:hypothetical protein
VSSKHGGRSIDYACSAAEQDHPVITNLSCLLKGTLEPAGSGAGAVSSH